MKGRWLLKTLYSLTSFSLYALHLTLLLNKAFDSDWHSSFPDFSSVPLYFKGGAFVSGVLQPRFAYIGHTSSLHLRSSPMNFFMLSHEYRLYLHLFTKRAILFEAAWLLPSAEVVVGHAPEKSVGADCPLLKRLGFNHALSSKFFMLSQPSRLVLFHTYVVALLALGVSSN